MLLVFPRDCAQSHLYLQGTDLLAECIRWFSKLQIRSSVGGLSPGFIGGFSFLPVACVLLLSLCHRADIRCLQNHVTFMTVHNLAVGPFAVPWKEMPTEGKEAAQKRQQMLLLSPELPLTKSKRCSAIQKSQNTQ